MAEKAGVKTTEFWLTTLVSAWTMFGGLVPAPWNGVVIAVATGLYTIGRGLAKGGIIRGTVGDELKK